MTRSRLLFAALVLAQAAHSVEEYVGRLWEFLPPARILSGLVSPDLERGFLIINIAILVFGVWCVLWPVRRGWPSATPIMWGWIVVEISNGFVHPMWSMANGFYTPGTGTAPFLLALALAPRGRAAGAPRGTSRLIWFWIGVRVAADLRSPGRLTSARAGTSTGRCRCPGRSTSSRR